MSPVIGVLLVYLGLLAAFALWSRRETGTLSGYYLAGKKLPYWVVAFSTNATGESGWLLLGLTGMGYAAQLIFVVMVAMMGLSVGTVAFIARSYGAGNTERVNHILYQSSVLTIGLGLTVAVVGNLVAAPILLLLGALVGFGQMNGLLGRVDLFLGNNYQPVLRVALLHGRHDIGANEVE